MNTKFTMAAKMLETLDLRDRAFWHKSEVGAEACNLLADVAHDDALIEDFRRTGKGIPPAFEDAYSIGYASCFKLR